MRIGPALLILPLSACVTDASERPLSVREVVRQAAALDGQEVVVRGWIEECQHLSCSLYASPGERGRDRVYYLSVGASKWFDAFAAQNAPTFVTFRARVDARCIDDPADDVILACSDRVNSLSPIRLVR